MVKALSKCARCQRFEPHPHPAIWPVKMGISIGVDAKFVQNKIHPSNLPKFNLLIRYECLISFYIGHSTKV